MIIKVTLPSELSLPTSSPTCTGISGTSYVTLTCTANTTAKTITITNAFDYQTKSPSNVTFYISNFTNPSTNVTTSSF